MLSSKLAQEQFGTPNITGKGYLVPITLPFPLRNAFNTSQSIKIIACHKDVADSLLQIFKDLLARYGYTKIKELGIDLYGGCFNYRKKTNSNYLSLHSWGIAIDLDPLRNKYQETKKTARFARPEYKPMIDIFVKNGWQSLGRTADFDWMHFQIAPKANTVKKWTRVVPNLVLPF